MIVKYEASFTGDQDFSIGEVQRVFTEAVESADLGNFEVDPQSISFEGNPEFTHLIESLPS